MNLVQAIEEIKIAENIFNNATTDEEIDIAINLMRVAEKYRETVINMAKGELN